MSSVASMLALTGSLRGEAPVAGAGAYLSIGSVGDALNCNLTTGFPTNGMSIVAVVRASALTFQPFLFFDSGNLGSAQCWGLTNQTYRLGLFEADLHPYHGRNFSNTQTDKWIMVASVISGSPYSTHNILTVDGATGQTSGGGGSSGAAGVDTVQNMIVHLGAPTTSFTGNANFDIAFARIYGAELTTAQCTQIWDHWAENNADLYTENGQTSPSFTAGRADYVTSLYAEWDFAKMASSSLQTTKGSAGTVTATLVGNATFVP